MKKKLVVLRTVGKKLFSVILFTFTYLNVIASPKDCMLIHFIDGSILVLPTAYEPRIYFDSGTVTISTENYQFSNIRKYTFADSDNTAISSIKNKGKYSLSKDSSKLTLKLSENDTKVKAYMLNGVEIPITINADNTAFIYLNNCPEKVLLLQIGDETIKIIR